MAEGLIAPVLKTGDGRPSVSSNLTASAKNTNQVIDLYDFVKSSSPIISPTTAWNVLEQDGISVSGSGVRGLKRPSRAPSAHRSGCRKAATRQGAAPSTALPAPIWELRGVRGALVGERRQRVQMPEAVGLEGAADRVPRDPGL